MAYDAGSPYEPARASPDPDERPDLHEWCERIFCGVMLIVLAWWTVSTLWSAIKVGFRL